MDKKQARFAAIAFVIILMLLLSGYFLFFRVQYEPLFSNIRENDAAAIVSKLEEEGVPFRLEDGGGTILVPHDDVNQARLIIAGSGLAMGNITGFELFNESDMGLTEFAQKINYLRALQGELARTIMTMDNISFARVHIALPERGLFRRSNSTASAAVTIHTMTGSELASEQVAGIQRLIASAIPELGIENVALLDHHGRLISPVTVSVGSGNVPTDRQTALELYLSIRVAEALADIFGRTKYNIDVSAVNTVAPAVARDTDAEETSYEEAYSVRIMVWTEELLDEPMQSKIRQAIVDELPENYRTTDQILFSTRPINSDIATLPDNRTRDVLQDLAPANDGEQLTGSLIENIWPIGAIALAVLFGGLLYWRTRVRSKMTDDEHSEFARILQRRLNEHQDTADA